MNVNDNIKIVGINHTFYLREDLEAEGIDTYEMTDDQVEDLWNKMRNKMNPSVEEWLEECRRREEIHCAEKHVGSYGIDCSGMTDEEVLAKSEELIMEEIKEYDDWFKSQSSQSQED